MPLTPQEQQELEALQGTIGQPSPTAVRVETPSSIEGLQREADREQMARVRGNLPPDFIGPSQRQLTENYGQAVSGAALSMAPELTQAVGAPIKAVGRGARSLVDFIGGKLAGLKPAQVAAYEKAPQTIEALLQAPALRQSQFAEQALQSTSNRLGSRAGQLENTLQGQFAGKTVPENSILPAEQFRPRTADLVTQTVPVSDVYEGARAAGDAAKFSPNPINPLAEQARVEAAGAERNVLRNAVRSSAPEAEPTIQALQQGIEAQKGLRSGATRPISFLESNAPDVRASRQAADSALDSTRLERTAGQLSTAKSLGTTPKDLYSKLGKPVGMGLLRGTSAVTPVANKATDLTAFLGSRGVIASQMPRRFENSNQSTLTPEEQAELDMLNRHAEN